MAITSMEDMINEAANIGQRFRAMPKNAPKDPYAVDRVVAIYQASGLSAQEFCRRTRGFSMSTLYMWSKGKSTSGQDWLALQAATAKREGAALAASMNTNLGSGQVMPTMTLPKVSSVDGTMFNRPSRAVAVTRWIDAAGNEHDTEQEAEMASWAHDVDVASERLGRALGLTTWPFRSLQSEVLGLADAIRAERSYLAGHQQTDAAASRNES